MSYNDDGDYSNNNKLSLSTSFSFGAALQRHFAARLSAGR